MRQWWSFVGAWLLIMTSIKSAQSFKVAVVGGAASGLAAARVFSRNGIVPIVLEKDAEVGGVWRHLPNSPKTRPMYQGLRTNLPREIMAYREKPWGGDGVGKSYVTHMQVLEYLGDYRDDFNLDQYISYNSKVTQLTVLPDTDKDWPQIQLTWEQHGQETKSDVFDAVCLCNGHYAQPSIPVIEGIDKFNGRTLHSVEYDDPSEFQGLTVLCIGARASGSDLAREISQHAQHVYLSDSTATEARTLGNLTWVPRTTCISNDGSCVEFAHDCPLTPQVDVIVYCSGYEYSFPFINDKSNLDLTVGQRRVKPLYKQLWHAQYPSLAFVGLPHSILPFPLFELQTEAVLATLLDHEKLPPLKERMEAAERDAQAGGPKETGRIEDTHYLGPAQWDYCRDMATIAASYDDKMENYIATNKAIFDHSGMERKGLFPGGPDVYRDSRYKRDDENQSFDVDSALVDRAMAA